LAGKPERMRPLETARRILDNIEIYLEEIRFEVVEFFQAMPSG
jgi:hypothetical protein